MLITRNDVRRRNSGLLLSVVIGVTIVLCVIAETPSERGKTYSRKTVVWEILGFWG